MNRNRKTMALCLGALVLVSTVGPIHAQAPAAKDGRGGAAAPRKAPKQVTLRGEILDMGCYTARGLKGAVHRDCGRQCVRMGVPMGLLTAGDSVYVLTENHDRAMAPAGFQPPDPFVQCGDWVSLQVEVTGFVLERGGARLLEVRAAKIAPSVPNAP